MRNVRIVNEDQSTVIGKIIALCNAPKSIHFLFGNRYISFD